MEFTMQSNTLIHPKKMTIKKKHPVYASVEEVDKHMYCILL